MGAASNSCPTNRTTRGGAGRGGADQHLGDATPAAVPAARFLSAAAPLTRLQSQRRLRKYHHMPSAVRTMIPIAA